MRRKPRTSRKTVAPFGGTSRKTVAPFGGRHAVVPACDAVEEVASRRPICGVDLDNWNGEVWAALHELRAAQALVDVDDQTGSRDHFLDLVEARLKTLERAMDESRMPTSAERAAQEAADA